MVIFVALGVSSQVVPAEAVAPGQVLGGEWALVGGTLKVELRELTDWLMAPRKYFVASHSDGALERKNAGSGIFHYIIESVNSERKSWSDKNS